MKKLIIHTDGGSRGNPGPAGIGVVISDENESVVFKAGKVVGQKTNNQAEYEAVIFALQQAKGIFKKNKSSQKYVQIYMDSELVCKQMNHEYKIINQNIIPLFLKVWNLMLDFDSVKFISVPREKNKQADALANQAMDKQEKNQGLPGI